MSGKGAQGPAAQGMVPGLEVVMEGGNLYSVQEEKAKRDPRDDLRALECTTMEILRAREQRSVPKGTFARKGLDRNRPHRSSAGSFPRALQVGQVA